jgi:acetolactate synthase-1/2/3 large subunit
VEDWKVQLAQWQSEYPRSYESRSVGKAGSSTGKSKVVKTVMPQAVISKVSEVTQGKAVVTTDVGQHQMWTAQYYDFMMPRSLITSGGLGTMGYGVPAAMGAQLAKPNTQVVCFCGDGGFMMTCQELITIVDLNLPVKIFLINNGYLGMVAQWQRKFFNQNYSHTRLDTKTDFVALAEAMGCKAMYLDSEEDLDGVVREALQAPGPVLVNVIIPADENVLPMVPPGVGLDEMILPQK